MAKGDLDDPIYYAFSSQAPSGSQESIQVSGAVDSTSIVSAITLGVKQVSGSIDSVSVIGTVPVSGAFFQSTQPVSVSDIFGSLAANLINPDGRLKVEQPSGASGLSDSELRASHLDVQQMSGSIWSNYVTGVAASTYAELLNPDGRVKVELPSGASSLTDSELRASPVPVSGTFWQATQPISGTVNVNGSTNSTVSVGAVLHDSVDDGAAPQKVGGTAMTANPVAVAGGDIVRFVGDKIGRQLVTPFQVRDLIATAYLSKATGSTFGTETTLRAGIAGEYLDLLYISLSNDSTATVKVDIRPVTAGNIVDTISIPAGDTVDKSYPVPYPQTDTGNNWTIDLPDITGTNVAVQALFARNI